MIRLDNYITVNEETINSPNLCDRFNDSDLGRISNWVLENYENDKTSRESWEARNQRGLNLAMQLQEDKTWPWPGSANIKFPLVTIAALQFHSRAYPAIINGNSVVQCKVLGKDITGEATARADKISRHMSWQCLEQDEAWEEQMDRGLIYGAICGTWYKKTYFDANLGHNVSEFVSGFDLVVNYWAKSITTAQVKTHEIPMYRNDVYERCKSGVYRDITDENWFIMDQVNPQPTPSSSMEDQRTGLRPAMPTSSTPFMILEQHCWLDLDDDGYAEPYIITVDKGSAEVLRIVLRCDRKEDVKRNAKGEIIKIEASEYFTKMPFIPSPDGSIMDIGFGVFLGPLNESVNSALNQLFDAGTLANTAGGFLGRGAKIRGGVYQFQPFGWNRVDSTGDDLRKSIFPLPVREPSAVMFQVLGLLIEYTNRISGSTEINVGENPGQNTPAETSRTMQAQGEKVYSAIFKRTWRAMKQEFKKMYNLNAIYMPQVVSFGDDDEITREDYQLGGMNIVPAADPLIASEGQRFAQAQMLVARADTRAGYSTDEAERRYLQALGVKDIEKVFPGAEGQEQPEDVKLTIQKLKLQDSQMKLQVQQQQFIITMQETIRVNNAKILEMEARAKDMDAKAQNEGAKQNVAAFRAGIEAIREQNNQTNSQLDRMMEAMNGGQTNGMGGAVSGLAAAPSNQGFDAVGLPTA